MNRQTKTKTIKQKAQMLRNRVSKFAICLTPARLFARNRRGVSAVVSNLILIAAVITLGLVALGFARSTSIDYQTDYAKSVGDNIAKLKESLVFEYAHYTAGDLTVYVLNSVTSSVNITAISINNSPVSLQTGVSIHRMDDSTSVNYELDRQGNPYYYLGKGVAVQIDVSDTSSCQGPESTIKITTWSGSNFEYKFLV